MSTRISPQIRIVALAGLLLAVAGGGASMLMTRSGGGPETVPLVTHARVTAPAATAPAPVAGTPAKHAVAPVKHVAKAATRTHHAAKPATHRGNLVDARLPAQLQWALSQHRIVVVSLYDPRADVDAISVAEAHAGAADARVGYLLVNVFDDKVAGPLTALLPGGGLLPDPGVLVYRAPGKLVYRFDGFTDRDTVAQAAANAKAGESDAAVTDPSLAQQTQTTTTP